MAGFIEGIKFEVGPQIGKRSRRGLAVCGLEDMAREGGTGKIECMVRSSRLEELLGEVSGRAGHPVGDWSMESAMRGAGVLGFGVLGAGLAWRYLSRKAPKRRPKYDGVGADRVKLEMWEKRMLSEEERRVAIEAKKVREEMKNHRGSDANTILEASGSDETVRTVVFRTGVFRERVFDVARTRDGVNKKLLRKLLLERRGWKITAFEVKDVMSELAEDIGAGRMGRFDRNGITQLGVNLLVINTVVIGDITKKQDQRELGEVLIRASEATISNALGLGNDGPTLSRESLLLTYRTSVREVVKDVDDAPQIAQFKGISAMLMLSEQDTETVIANEGGLGIRDMLKSAAAARRRRNHEKSADILDKAIKTATYLLGAVGGDSKSILVSCDRYLHGCGRVIGMESNGILRDYAIRFGNQILTQGPSRVPMDGPGVLRRLLVSADTTTVYSRAFGEVAEDAIAADLYTKPSAKANLVSLRRALELPESVWRPIAEKVLAVQSEMVPTGEEETPSNNSFASIARFLGVPPKSTQQQASSEALARRLDTVFNSVRTAEFSKTAPVDVDAIVALTEKLGITAEEAARDTVASSTIHWISNYLKAAVDAFQRNDSLAMQQNLQRTAKSVTEIVSPLYIALGQGGLDRKVVSPRLKRQFGELKLRHILRVYESQTFLTDDVSEILTEYILSEPVS
mmetsp:Transcript_285/g.693  ORF Transcript_285/g.693 Transcript_285/m.693 type:complete len:687 (-) Transcript_285:415-2475(-)|eukprot:CAMPEP_0113963880 /NCGR_PEP_ID=MMETSP0011_2-20120614/6783_1 /TAXON_ID=101924 /ORGANISM="Rhodosorus marinus" /LENGTH=686 /DNA_ID=CAMNT_0000976027 /DNA_START=96 /DNA_END=2156 /DNA_ORIENTATION=+ /assembly_acc=CAM_ASM_000156